MEGLQEYLEAKNTSIEFSDNKCTHLTPYLMLMQENAAQRKYLLRAVFNGLHHIMRTGDPWCMMPHDLPR